MTLERLIKRQIATQGPIGVADYMRLALMHPTLGYCTTRAPFGATGDFVTAPEISQMFGELLGLALAQAWQDQGSPARFTLAELGPGRGTLMRDLLRAARRVPGFHEAARVTLLEASPALQKAQAELLSGVDPVWIDSLADCPDQPLFLIANEFFDALPVAQYVRAGPGWRARQIGLDGEALSFGLGAVQPVPALDHRLQDTADGDLVEHCPDAIAIAGAIGARIQRSGGAALIIDYGDWRSLGDTLQAVRAHRKTDPLAEPGMADLTTHVDFEAIALACAPAVPSRLTTQGVFLERLGITARAQALARGLSGPALDNHVAAHRRLIHPDEMGTLFKVLGITPQGSVPPPGLET